MSHELKIKFFPPKKSYAKLKSIASEFSDFIAGGDAGSPCEIIVNEHNFEKDCPLLIHFWNIVKKYPETAIYLDGKLQTREQAEKILDFVRCYANRQYFPDTKEYCFICPNKPGFGCKQLCSVVRYSEMGRHKGKRWYSFGPFENNIQYIDKADIKETLLQEAYKKGLYLCPCFDIRHIDKHVSELPDQINPKKDDNWEFKLSDEPENREEIVGVKPKIDFIVTCE